MRYTGRRDFAPQPCLTARRSGKFHETDKRASRASLDTSFYLLAKDVELIGDTNPKDELERRVLIFEAESTEIEAKKASLPSDVIKYCTIRMSVSDSIQSFRRLLPLLKCSLLPRALRSRSR